MAMRSRTTFKKRQKELARQEKQRDKAARRLQRKLEKNNPESGENPDGENDFLDEGPLEEGDADQAEQGLESVAESGASGHQQ
ncbi:MAG: hypothetical protein U0Q18_27940 [Bryobacteraceae bacterium]